MKYSKNAELLNIIKNRNLPKSEIMDRLNLIIDAESAMPDSERDDELINACLDLQWYLITGEHYKSNKGVARKKFNRMLHTRSMSLMKRPLIAFVMVISITTAALVLPMAVQILLERSWIEGTTIEGGEIYQLNGENVDPKQLASAIAGIDDEDIMILTSDFSVISELTIVKNIHPKYTPNEWICYLYRYEKLAGVVLYSEQYVNSNYGNEEYLYRCMIYPDSDAVDDFIEQEYGGKETEVGKRSIYWTQNYEQLVATWNDHFTNSIISAPFEKEEIIKIIHSIGDTEI